MDNFLYRIKKHIVQNDFHGRYETKERLGAGSYAEVIKKNLVRVIMRNLGVCDTR